MKNKKTFDKTKNLYKKQATLWKNEKTKQNCEKQIGQFLCSQTRSLEILGFVESGF
jgi:hypothetical protein